jgi:deoxyribonucleoside regulator
MNLNDHDFLIEIAKMYYEEELSQGDIAEKLQISRPTVAGLLKRCKEEKVVEIIINSASSLVFGLQKELESMFGLKKAIIVSSEGDLNLTKINIGRAAADYIISILQNNMKIGIAWGTTLYQAVTHIPQTNFVDIDIVQLIGSLGSLNPTYDGYELAMNLAKKLNGRYHIIQAPVIVKSIEVKNMLLEEPRISEVLLMSKKVDLALVGIDELDRNENSLIRSGFITKEETESVIKDGAAGQICGLHYDIKGKLLNTPFTNRFISVSAEDLFNIPTIIGMACGVDKAASILGALRGGFINSLITDEAAALRILSELKR